MSTTETKPAVVTTMAPKPATTTTTPVVAPTAAKPLGAAAPTHKATPPTKPLATAPVPSKESVIGTQLDIPETVDPLLVTILSWPRSHGSYSELAFCEWLTKSLVDLGYVVTKWEEGSMFVDVLHPGGKRATTLFSCHVDTVDGFVKAEDPADPTKITRKKLTYDSNFGHITLDKDSVGGCLGADDGAGVWVMLNMIAAGVPGGYLFHRGEECGGVSAKANARKREALLKRFDAAVAFDRPRCNEIITHQGGTECASNEYALALAAALNKHGFEYKPSTTGVYTDTKEYRKIIAECINIGVGYEQQHGRNEFQDYAHLKALTEAACNIDWEALPVDRDPTKPEPVFSGGYAGYKGYGAYGYPSGNSELWDDDDHAFGYQGKAAANTKAKKPKGKDVAVEPKLSVLDDLELLIGDSGVQNIEWLVEHEPQTATATIVALLRERAALKADVKLLETLLGGDYVQ